ncbi:MAG: translocation/assembly module TamB domain-containing protein [Rhodanobacteraceae bacterium]|nr:translocation/assembly module TamB domain-containing protein [Rhodanobacteraceae bacterium]
MSRLHRNWLVALALLLVLAATALVWALYSEAGLRLVLGRVLASTGGKLTIESAEGRLAGPLVLRKLRWRDTGVDVQIGQVTLDIAPFALLGKVAHVENLAITDAIIATTTTQTPPSDAPLPLQPPLDIQLDRLVIERVRLQRDGAETFVADRFSTSARWQRDSRLTIEKLALQAPQGEIRLDGEITPLAEYRGKADGRFRWQLDGTDYAGTLSAVNDGNLPRATLQLQAPLALQASVNADASNQPLATRDWLFALKAERFDARKLLKDSSLKTLALDLTGRFSATRGELAGTVDIDEYTVQVEPARYRLAQQTLVIEALSATSPMLPGRLDLSGELPLSADASAHLSATWKDLLLPAALVGQELAGSGNLRLAGTTRQFTLSAEMQIGPPGRPTDISLAASGNNERIALEHVLLQQHHNGKPAGSLNASGEVSLKPVPGWKLEVSANQLDPGTIAAGWPGTLNLQFATEGQQAADGVSATLKMPKLDGSLRQRPITGTADLRIAPGPAIDGTLALASGDSTLAVRGYGSETMTDAHMGFTLASLGDLLPQAQGRLRGQLGIKGRWPALTLDAQADGTGLVYADSRAASLTLSANIADLSAARGRLELLATGVNAAGQPFDRITLAAKGDRDSHELSAGALGSVLSTQLQLRGKLSGENWSGALNALTLELKDQPPWALEQPAALSYATGTTTLGELCLAAQGPRLCISGQHAADGSMQGRYRLERLPLATLTALSAPDTTLELSGEINGSGNLRRSAQGALDGSARISSAAGRIAYTDRPDQALLAYSDLAMDAAFSPSSQRLVVQGNLADGGSISGSLDASGAEQDLSGQIQLKLGNMSFVELFSSELAGTKGQLDGRLVFGGTVATPSASGQILVDGFVTEVPEAGLKLADGKIQVDLDNRGSVAISGSIRSGQGQLKISGSSGISADAPLDILIEGEDFLAADIPAAHLVLSPKLRVRRNEQGLVANGEIGMPRADIDLTRLPGGGAAKISPDVVIVDTDAAEHQAAQPITADVTVKLGEAVKLKGFGLDGKLDGQLVVVERPGRQTTGRGEIRVGGTYKAYGQDLKIQTGRLLFASTAIDNPGLDLKAVRELRDVTAGLRVQGTAQAPLLTVFSEPALEQSEALSYLITGRPLSALKSGEGDLVGAAAQALGSATGDLLAKSVGARLGVDAAVSDNAAIGGAAFTVGKYLSPKLYLSYGVGIFTPGEVITLRYKLSRLWELEAQNATTENRAGLNYRLEK